MLAACRQASEARDAGLLPGQDGLRVEFASLALAYERCAMLTCHMHQSALHRWLSDRARMHREHVMFLGL